MLLRKRKLLHEDDVKIMWSSRRMQPPVECLWCLVSLFPGLSVNSDNLFLSYVILFLYALLCHYMHETWSWHAYRFALGFLWKNRCDMNVAPCGLLRSWSWTAFRSPRGSRLVGWWCLGCIAPWSRSCGCSPISGSRFSRGLRGGEFFIDSDDPPSSDFESTKSSF
jgi:hypothetical protein